jgi:hypothetical protein
MRMMTAKYAGTCAGCGQPIKKGTTIAYAGRGEVYHSNCKPSGDTQADQDYYAGLNDGRMYSEDRKMFGDELAEQFEMDRERFRYNHGLDGY